ARDQEEREKYIIPLFPEKTVGGRPRRANGASPHHASKKDRCLMGNGVVVSERAQATRGTDIVPLSNLAKIEAPLRTLFRCTGSASPSQKRHSKQHRLWHEIPGAQCLEPRIPVERFP